MVAVAGEKNGFKALFQEGEDELHFSFGLGISTGRFRIDAAFDYSQRISTSSLSSVVRF